MIPNLNILRQIKSNVEFEVVMIVFVFHFLLITICVPFNLLIFEPILEHHLPIKQFHNYFFHTINEFEFKFYISY